MSYPTIELDQKKVTLLRGFETTQTTNTPLAITAREKLEEVAKKTAMLSRLLMSQASGCRRHRL